MTSPASNTCPEWGVGRVADPDGGTRVLIACRGAVLDAEDLARRAGWGEVSGTLGWLERLRESPGDLEIANSVAETPSRFLPPIASSEVGKILALGRSFPAHARELGNEALPDPLVFSKLPENMIGSGDSLVLPRKDGERFDNEVELAVVIGRPLRRADAAAARDAIAGFTVMNDFTWRSAQARAKEHGHPWFTAKNLPGALPIGPWIVPPSALPAPDGLEIRCRINGDPVQGASMSGLVRPVAELIAWLSAAQPLNPGDVVSMGTPKGVTSVRPGDRVEAEIVGIGVLETGIVEEEVGS